MKYQFTGRKVNLKDAFKERAQKKLAKLERIFADDALTHVIVTVEKNRQRVEVTVQDAGLVIRGEAAAPDMETALDEVIDVLGGQIRKHKSKLGKRIRAASFDELPEAEEEKFEVVRTKYFPLKPLYVDEAILQMNLLGHQFFVFQNPDTGKTNVVYRRKNGGYGLLQPEDDQD